MPCVRGTSWAKSQRRPGLQWLRKVLASLRPARARHASSLQDDLVCCSTRSPSGRRQQAVHAPVAGHFLESGRFHPAAMPAQEDSGPLFQLYGDTWRWTASPNLGYPGYRPTSGALGEYNAKFTCNQFVLRGASCATPHSHTRRTYRNFFPPEARWQFIGLRLARDA